MKLSTWLRLFAGLVAVAFLVNAPAARAQDFNSQDCAWPLLFSPEGSGNIQGPDSAARYWIMPFDTQYETMTIKGTYPNVRFFSFTAYKTKDYDATQNTNGGFHLVDDHLYDAQIAPDPGSVNPFVVPGNRTGTYTVVFTRTGSTSGNTIRVPADPPVFTSALTWIVLRMYVSDDDPSQSGQSLMGGVPLPAITLAGTTGPEQLDTCWPINQWPDISAMGQFLFSPKDDLKVDAGTPSSDRLWFASPKDPPSILWPNPDGKYMMMWPGENYQPGRIIVIRGKAPRFPGAFGHSPKGASSRGHRGVDMRYWALCHQNFAAPLPLIGCVTDLTARLEGGDYTTVISDDRQRPDWLRPDVNWLPYGDEQYPKFVVIRNMLPAAGFHHAIQDVWNYKSNSCTFDLKVPNLPNRKALDDKGPCAKAIMGDYYPDAFWCDKSTFVHGGWRACAKTH
jgi:hypothetical protein